jgi:hypothetical protein
MRTVIITLLCLLPALPLWGSSKAVSLPFTTNPDGLIIVLAKVGGTIPIHFIFDTGAGLDALAPSLIQRLGGKPAGQFTAFRMTGERLDIPLFIIPELSIGPMMKKDAVVAGWDVLDKWHIDCIMSLNGFRQQPVTFDFVNKALIFETPRTLAHLRAVGKSSRLQLHDERGIALDVFAEFLVGSERAQCEIDTGSASATVTTRFMASLGVEVAKDERHEGSYKGILPEISLAAAPQVTLARPRVSFSNIIYDCLVGVDFWSAKALTIDVAHRQLIVSYPSTFR